MPLLIKALAQASAGPAFPERSPAMIKACPEDAASKGEIMMEEDDRKYICGGAPARALWTFLEAARVEFWEQDASREGSWLSREFPLGGCFKRVRNSDGSSAKTGLSCSIRVPALSQRTRLHPPGRPAQGCAAAHIH
jgi:hypothetical protein